jgi:hypothetical protein
LLIVATISKGGVSMTRKDRSDQTVGGHEKKHGLPPGTIRNSDGRDTRADKKIGTIRKEAEKKK